MPQLSLNDIYIILKVRGYRYTYKSSGIGVWDKEDYLAEAKTLLKDKDV